MTTASVDQDELLTAVREYARREIAPTVAGYDREERFPVDIVRDVAKLGWIGAVIDPEYGGLGLDWLSFARTRQVFGADIGRFQLVQSMITDMIVGSRAPGTWCTTWPGTRTPGSPGRDGEPASRRCMPANVAMAAATSSVQIHGAYGISEEYPVARYFRDAKVFQIVEGNNQLHRGMLAEYALGYRRPDQ